MKKYNRKYIWSGVVIVVFLLVSWIYLLGREESSVVPTQIPTLSVSPVRKPTTGQSSGLVLANITPKISYYEALQKYDNIMQFDDFCHPQPYPNLVAKTGSSFMFDNRTSKSIIIGVDNQKFTIKAYAWIALTAKSNVLPYEINIDCNTGRNNGTILLQK